MRSLSGVMVMSLRVEEMTAEKLLSGPSTLPSRSSTTEFST